MQEKVARFRPGNSVSVEYVRNGKKYKSVVILKNKSNTTTIVGNESMLKDLGFELRDLTRSEKQTLKVRGAYVLSITRGSKIERTNMDPGFIITKINDQDISGVEDVLNILKSASGKIMLEGIYESYPGEYYYAFPI